MPRQHRSGWRAFVTVSLAAAMLGLGAGACSQQSDTVAANLIDDEGGGGGAAPSPGPGVCSLVDAAGGVDNVTAAAVLPSFKVGVTAIERGPDGATYAISWPDWPNDEELALWRFDGATGATAKLGVDVSPHYSGNQSFDNHISATSLSVASDGSIYVAGYFTRTVTFGATTLESYARQDLFVAKASYSEIDGLVWQWAVQGNPGTSLVMSRIAKIEVTDRGVWIVGAYDTEADHSAFGSCDYHLGGLCIPSTNHGYVLDTDAFVARLSTDGDFEWIRVFGEYGDDTARALAVDKAGYAYVGGSSYGAFDLAGYSLPNNDNAFLVKFAEDGDVEWMSTVENASTVAIWDLATEDDRLFVLGDFMKTADFNGGISVTQDLSLTLMEDLFISEVKTDTGDFAWVETIHNVVANNGYGYQPHFAVSDGEIFVATKIAGAHGMPTEFAGMTFLPANPNSTLLATYDLSGGFGCATMIEGMVPNAAYGDAGSWVLGGQTSESLVIDGHSLPEPANMIWGWGIALSLDR